LRRWPSIALLVGAGLVVGVGLLALGPTLGGLVGSSELPSFDAASVRMSWGTAESGWMVVNERDLYHTIDGAGHWVRVTNQPSLNSTSRIKFFDAVHGVILSSASASDSWILSRTDDGGQNWRQLPTTVAKNVFAFPFVLDSDHLWLTTIPPSMEARGDFTIARTDNGGASWTELVRIDRDHPQAGGLSRGLRSPFALFFSDDLDGWLGQQSSDGSPTLYETHDGGRQWQKLSLPTPRAGWQPLLPLRPYDGGAIPMAGTVSNGQGMLWVSATERTGRGSLQHSLIYWTQDNGVTWTGPIRPPGTESFPQFSGSRAAWLEDDAGSFQDPIAPPVWVTSDAGQSWSSRPLPLGWRCESLAQVSSRVAWCASVFHPYGVGSPRSRLFRTIDGGLHWEPMAFAAI
jgi:photosystem II stability/assembly factor-like uncharacterized protein